MVKRKRFLTIAIVSSVLLSGSIAFLATSKTNRGLFSKAEEFSYSIVLDETNAMSTSGTKTQKTKQRGSSVRFEYFNVGTYSEGHCKLNVGGSIKNLDQISSITSVESSFVSSGNLYFRVSYDNTNWTDKLTLNSNQEYILNVKPYYIEFLTDDINEVSINSIKIKYECEENPDSELGKPQIWEAITTSSVDLTNVSIGSSPYGLKLSYYSDIYSRGFAWTTNTSTPDSELYIVKSNLGVNADFSSSAQIVGTTNTSRSDLFTHKAYVENLDANTMYSYKVGGPDGYAYGIFKTEVQNPNSIMALSLSDAQTMYKDELYVWENTFAQGIETAGRSADFVLYNGDQFQYGGSPDLNFVEYSASIETINSSLEYYPYMSGSGNHEYAKADIFTRNNCINFAGTDTHGGYYSFDYGNTHFVVLNSSTANDGTEYEPTGTVSSSLQTFNVVPLYQTQAQGLVNDLETASYNSKWIVVMMHVGPHSTGDHCDSKSERNALKTFTPIFSYYHVDLVLQAHDHVFTKTYPYRWDTAGHTEIRNNNEIVNFSPEIVTLNGRTYDKNPNGTYYVTTGAAGHRVGEQEKKDGVYADVIDATGEPLYPGKTYKTSKYAIEVGRIKYSNSYTPYTIDGHTSDQIFNAGDYATGNVNTQMFAILNINGDKLNYDFYTVEGNTVKLFDSLDVYKPN